MNRDRKGSLKFPEEEEKEPFVTHKGSRIRLGFSFSKNETEAGEQQSISLKILKDIYFLPEHLNPIKLSSKY